jgi:hypothetical protein
LEGVKHGATALFVPPALPSVKRDRSLVMGWGL